MQISIEMGRNGLILAISGFAVATLLDPLVGDRYYSLLPQPALASAAIVEIAQTTANELLVEVNRLLDEGWQQMKSGQYQAAIASYEDAIASARNIGAQQQEAEALMGIGVVDSLLNSHQQAIASRKQAFSIYQSLGQLNGAASAQQGIGDSYRALGDYSQAEAHFRQALSIYQQAGDTASEQYILSLLEQLASGQ